MMKLLVNQAYDQMGLPVTQLIGTLLDGAARHTPEGVAFTRAAIDDVRARGRAPRRPVRRLRAGGPVRRWRALARARRSRSRGCGDSGPTDEEQVRTTLTAFSRATAAKDYQALCDRLLAPSLIADLRRSACHARSRSSRGSATCSQPRLIVGEVNVNGKTATAQVRTSARARRRRRHGRARAHRRRLADRVAGHAVRARARALAGGSSVEGVARYRSAGRVARA